MKYAGKTCRKPRYKEGDTVKGYFGIGKVTYMRYDDEYDGGKGMWKYKVLGMYRNEPGLRKVKG